MWYIAANESAKTFGGPGVHQIADVLLGRLKDKTSFPSPLGVAELVTKLMSFCFMNIPRATSGVVLGMSTNLSRSLLP
jgi:hypothetical protein